MAMRSPSKLRYVQCDLPDNVEQAIADFEDDFDARFQPFYDRVADFTANTAPTLAAILDEQVALRQQLVDGSPVQSLSSLDAIDANLGLTSPARNDNDADTKRVDERKLGAANICLLNGKMYRMLPKTNRLEAFRYLWEIVGGNYDLFVTYGMDIYSSALDSLTLYEYNAYKPENMPFVNKGFNDLAATGHRNSQFKHRMFWNKGLSASFAYKSKMATFGYDSDQINNTFSGKDVNASYDFVATIGTINLLVQAVTRLLFLPKTDRLRQPLWENEANYIIMAIQTFLEYRTRKYTSSSIFDQDFFPILLQEMTPSELKELLEQRPEVSDLELPQDVDSVSSLVESAVGMSAGAKINTYMVNLPSGDKEELTLTDSLYDLGLSIWKHLEVQSSKANQLEDLLLELKGQVGPLDINTSKLLSPSVTIDPADLSALFPTANLPPQGALVDAVIRSGIAADANTGSGEVGTGAGVNNNDLSDASTAKALINSSIAANSAVKKFSTSESKKQKKARQKASDSDSPTPVGSVQGFQTAETFAMILTRRVDWGKNFLDCSGNTVYQESAPPAYEAQDVLINEGKLSPEWKQYTVDLNFIKKKFKLSAISVSDIRSALRTYLSTPVAAGGALGLISPNDAVLLAALTKINSSADVKQVTSGAANLVREVDKKNVASLNSGVTTNENQTFNAGNSAAKDRRYLTAQGGKQTSPGLTAGETAKLKAAMEKVLNQKLPFVSSLENSLNTQTGTSFKVSISAETKICTPKAIAQIGAYLDKYAHKLEAWLIRLINILRHQIIMFQDKIDALILAIQGAMDALLAKLERLLSLDLNFSGKIGFENSLFKCSWGLDLGLKINLLDYLLSLLDLHMPALLAGFLKGLQILADALTELFCIPIRWLESLMGAASELLSAIGCTVKDFKLPLPILDLLNLLMGMFNLRSLVLRKGKSDWIDALGRFNLGKNEWRGLTQFAAICSNPRLKDALSAVQASMTLQASNMPVASNSNAMAGEMPVASNSNAMAGENITSMAGMG